MPVGNWDNIRCIWQAVPKLSDQVKFLCGIQVLKIETGNGRHAILWWAVPTLRVSELGWQNSCSVNNRQNDDLLGLNAIDDSVRPLN